jgi:transcriptional regulator with XRE-family HTH domain
LDGTKVRFCRVKNNIDVDNISVNDAFYLRTGTQSLFRREATLSVSRAVESDELLKSQVDVETTDRFIAEKQIGERIKRLRLKKSMGLVELGRHSGLSASFLSQLETGRVVPTLRNLARIAMVFSKDLSYFFEPEPQSIFRIHRRSERVRLPQTGVQTPTYFFESLAYMVPDRCMDPFFAQFLPLENEMEAKAHVHHGVEFLYVLEGELGLRHGEQECVLEAGDAAYFDANAPHSYVCAGTKPVGAIIVTMPQAAAPPMRVATSSTRGTETQVKKDVTG